MVTIIVYNNAMLIDNNKLIGIDLPQAWASVHEIENLSWIEQLLKAT